MTKQKQKPVVYARLCWNNNGWRQPAGVAPAAESRKGSFPKDYGFGMEEWLFDFTRLVDGWKYGFIQAALKGFNQWSGATIDVHLYTKTPSRERVLVGIIRDLEVLDAKSAASARKEFRKRGWLKEMKAEAEAVDAIADVFDKQRPEEVANVRFRPESFECFAAGRTVAQRHPLATRGRYQFEAVGSEIRPSKKRKGREPSKPSKSWVERGEYERDMPEARLQRHLAKLLRRQHGESAVETEVGGIDLLLTLPGRTVMVELKSDPDARLAVRRALGQLLEYQRFEGRKELRDAELVVVSPAFTTPEVEAYLGRLAKDTGLVIRHVRLTLEDTTIQL